ncbi:MAG: diacylglycerol kinase [Epsilonproteobacteria bacterium]|nr:MAG: diacylglycerol kinase [Campylobacterota bacterium]
MNNKPKYNLFKNTSYAIDGLICAIKTETSFKLELVIGLIAALVVFLAPFVLWQKIILVSTYVLILIVELLNSAIENIVDLVTADIHPLAKNAKDLGATAVLFSVCLHIFCWIVVTVYFVKFS